LIHSTSKTRPGESPGRLCAVPLSSHLVLRRGAPLLPSAKPAINNLQSPNV
jgi:hypothetical protein